MRRLSVPALALTVCLAGTPATGHAGSAGAVEDLSGIWDVTWDQAIRTARIPGVDCPR